MSLGRIILAPYFPFQRGTGPPLTHLFFANDVLLFCKATKDQARVVDSTLVLFGAASDLKVKLQKSKMICSRGVNVDLRGRIENIVGYSCSNSLGKYLGQHLIEGHAIDNDFNHIVHKV